MEPINRSICKAPNNNQLVFRIIRDIPLNYLANGVQCLIHCNNRNLGWVEIMSQLKLLSTRLIHPLKRGQYKIDNYNRVKFSVLSYSALLTVFDICYIVLSPLNKFQASGCSYIGIKVTQQPHDSTPSLIGQIQNHIHSVESLHKIFFIRTWSFTEIKVTLTIAAQRTI